MPALPSLHITPAELRIGADGSRKRFRWPWSQMQPGDHIDVFVPASFVRHVTSCACNHARSDGSVRLTTKVRKRVWDDEARVWITQLRVTCNATEC